MSAPSPLEALEAACHAAGDAADVLLADAAQLAAAEGVARLVLLLRTVEEARRKLYVAEDELKAAAANLADRRLTELPGLATLERKRASNRTTWDTDRLVPVVVATALEGYRDADAYPQLEAGAIIAGDALHAAARLEWRVGGLESLGIDADLYREVERGRMTVVVRWADHDEPVGERATADELAAEHLERERQSREAAALHATMAHTGGSW